MTSRIRHAFALGLVAAAVAMSAQAEMLEFPSPDGMKSWPKIATIRGWHQDPQASFANTANAIVSDEDVYPDGNAIILARGFPRAGKSLAQMIEDDKAQKADGANVAKLPDILDKDQVAFTIMAYTPAKSGKYEAVAYAEEGRYFLAFTLSAKNKAEYDKAWPFFVQTVENYAAMIPW
jgi:hypothetical protein